MQIWLFKHGTFILIKPNARLEIHSKCQQKLVNTNLT